MKKILLAEHDTFLINVYANQLRKMGCSISVATSGDVVVSRAANINPDLIIIDASLPQNDNLIIIKKLREELGLKDLKIVVLSDFGQEVQEDFRTGALKFLSKAENTSKEIAEHVQRILS